MSKIDTGNTLKRLRNHYRLVIMNEDTYEEVVKFKLSRTTVYVLFSSIFILMITLTSALIIFTPLKYYLPGVGYENAKEVREFRSLKIRTDSMEQALQHQSQYLNGIQKVLEGKVPSLDTNRLALPKEESSDD